MILLSGGWYFYQNFMQEKPQTTSFTTEKEWKVVQDDIQIAIESDGKVVAEDGVELSFSISGDTLEVENVYVSEGDSINKGDKIASVTTKDLEFSLQSTYYAYESALSNLAKAQEEPTQAEIEKALANIEEAKINLEQAELTQEQTQLNGEQKIYNAEKAIETAERSLESSAKNLESAENNLQKSDDSGESEIIQDAYTDLYSELKSISVFVQSLLYDADDILGIDNEYVNNDFESLLSLKNSTALVYAKAAYSQAKTVQEDFEEGMDDLTKTEHEKLNSAIKSAENSLGKIEELFETLQIVIDATESGTNLSQSELENMRSSTNNNISSITNTTSSLIKNIQAIDDAEDSVENYELNYEKTLLEYEKAESDLEDAQKGLKDMETEVEQDNINTEISISTKKLSLRQAEISYEELIEPADELDLASARNQVKSAAINVEKAKYEISQATLISPIDGEVVLLNYKAGDIIDKDNAKIMAEIINNDTLFIEVNIEEADINKIEVGQKAYATFDAVEDLELEGEISFISLTSDTSSNGIVTYLVRIMFDNTGDTGICKGMTAFVNFVTAEAQDVLVVPVNAVKNIDGQPSVILQDGTVQNVTTGFTDGENVEIISGLEDGEIILYQ